MPKSDVRTAAKAIIIRDGRLLTIAHAGSPNPWYSLPGGGQRAGESLPEALRRECREEIGCDVVVGALRFVRDYIADHHEFAAEHPGYHKLDLFFTCTLAAGAVPRLGDKPDGSQSGIAWLPVADLTHRDLYPRVLRHVLAGGPTPNPYLGDVN